jgi:dienelactone hydrolase
MKLRVASASSLFDEPLKIAVSGAKSKASVVVRVSSTDVNGVTFASEATFHADGHGAVSPARDAPVVGSYSGRQAMGLIDSMSPTSAGGPMLYFWGEGQQPFTFTASSGGRHAAPVTIARALLKPGVTQTPVRLEQAGFAGQLWQPAPGTARKPAVLLFGGSEGGIRGQLIAGLLASHGHPALNIAYFNAPGLQPTLSSVPLEYFTTALKWFGGQPNVDPHHVFVLGTSRGSEAALLLGAHFPDLVAGVIASVPSNVALCSPTCDGPAWTLNGQPLPYTSQFNNPAPTDEPAAVIPVERVRGPILLICGGSDQVWHSCNYAKAIVDRLNANHTTQPHRLLSYASAGHGVGTLVRYEPGGTGSLDASIPNATGQILNTAGATPDANTLARAKVWPRVIAFLNEH